MMIPKFCHILSITDKAIENKQLKCCGFLHVSFVIKLHGFNIEAWLLDKLITSANWNAKFNE
ncbi:CLUMA_CG018872, isoform A [Clunio marinus]|uniref:CLUMA_CG018872, isoform A n=1 Tax=Clunio marinus TaxID=568069 RepID=A0A1J1J301_9DIPT|nr:CLUMA_CG018872, isoform A [Clunio marinus]